jgi:hypothetical protein
MKGVEKEMRKKLISFLVCIILIAVTIPSVVSTQMSDSIYSITETDKNIANELSSGLAKKYTPSFSDQIKKITKSDSRSLTFYAYNTNDPSHQLVEGPVYFDPADPGTIKQIAPTTSKDFISGGTWADGIWYGCEYGIGGNTNLWTINNETGDMTLVGSYYPEAISLNGLAYNTITGTMFGCSDTNLYIMDKATGATKLIGSFGITAPCLMIGLSFDDQGKLYGEELTTDSLYLIDPTTGKAKLIGPLGININYAQDMEYDNNTKTMYLAAYTISPVTEGALYTCNTTTGAAKKVGTFQGKAQITGLAIPPEGGGGPPPKDTIPPVTTHTFDPSVPDGENGWYKNNVTLTITATDDISGVAWTKYSLNNGVSWTTHTESYPFDVILSDGEHKILYYSIDNAGNVETTKGPFISRVDTTIPDQRFFSIFTVAGPFVFTIVNIGFVKDGCSGLDRVEFLINNNFHHQVDLSRWPVGIVCVVTWVYYFPGVGDKCSGIVYDKAGNWQKMIQTTQIPDFLTPVKMHSLNSSPPCLLI